MKYNYTTSGTCSRNIGIEVDEAGVIVDVKFEGGCHGNLQGISALIKGMKVSEAAARLKGIDCRGKGTSCPDQLSKALEQIACTE